MNAFSTRLLAVSVAANHRYVTCKRNRLNILPRCYWCFSFNVTLFRMHVEILLQRKIWYCNTGNTGARLYRFYKARKLLKQNYLAKLFWHETNFQRFTLKSLNIRGAFRAQSNISDGTLLRKQLKTFT